MTSGLRITLHTQRSTGLCFCFVVSTAAGAGLEPNLQRDDTPQSQRVCGASSQAGGERMFGRGKNEGEAASDWTERAVRLLSDAVAWSCCLVASVEFVKFHELSLFFWSNN